VVSGATPFLLHAPGCTVPPNRVSRLTFFISHFSFFFTAFPLKTKNPKADGYPPSDFCMLQENIVHQRTASMSH